MVVLIQKGTLSQHYRHEADDDQITDSESFKPRSTVTNYNGSVGTVNVEIAILLTLSILLAPYGNIKFLWFILYTRRQSPV